MMKKYFLVALIGIIFITGFGSAFNFQDFLSGGGDTTISTTTYTGNLTNLLEMQDVSISSPSDGQFLRFISGTGLWTKYTFDLSDFWDYDYNDLINIPSGLTNPFDQDLNTTDSPTFENLTVTGYFIGDGSQLTGIVASAEDYSLLVSVDNITDFPTTLSFFTDDLGDRGYTSLSNFTNDYSYYNSTTIPSYLTEETNWNANYSDFLTVSAWNDTGLIKDWNASGLIIDWSGEIENANTSLYNWIVAQGYTSGGISWADATNGTLALSSEIPTDNNQLTNGNDYWNDTYATFNKTYADTLYAGIEWDYNQTIAAINKILSFGYYNSTDFDISNYYTKSEIDAFNYYNDTNFPYTHLSNFTNDLSFLTEETNWNANYSDFLTVYTWNDTGLIKDWTSDIEAANTSLYNWIVAQGYLTDALTWAEATNGTLFLTSQYNSSGLIQNWSQVIDTSSYATLAEILAFNYYNSTDFDIADYLTTADAATTYSTIDEPLWTANYTAYNDSWSSTYNATYDAYNSTGLIINWSEEIDTSSFATLAEILGFGYYNLTDFDIADYVLTSNLVSLVGNWSADKGDYYTSAQVDAAFATIDEPLWTANFTAYNDTWSAGISWAEATNGTLAELSTILGYGYYNSTDFDIADYLTTSSAASTYATIDEPLWTANWTAYNSTWSQGISWEEATNGTLAELSTVLGFNYYNATDFDIADYYTSSQIDSFNYYNSTDFNINDYATLSTLNNGTYSFNWDYDYTDLINKPTIPTAVSDLTNDYSYYNSTTIPTYVETEVDPKWTGNSTLVPYLASNNKFTANQNMTGNNVTNLDCIIFSNGGSWCGI